MPHNAASAAPHVSGSNPAVLPASQHGQEPPAALLRCGHGEGKTALEISDEDRHGNLPDATKNAALKACKNISQTGSTASEKMSAAVQSTAHPHHGYESQR